MALTNSGETHRMGERTGDAPSSGPFWPSLVMRRRGAAASSSKDNARAWTPEKSESVTAQLRWDECCSLIRHRMLVVVSHRECSLHRPLCACSNQTRQSICRSLSCFHMQMHVQEVENRLAARQVEACRPQVLFKRNPQRDWFSQQTLVNKVIFPQFLMLGENALLQTLWYAGANWMFWLNLWAANKPIVLNRIWPESQRES